MIKAFIEEQEIKMAVNELLSLLEYIEQERGISRSELIDAIEKSLVSAERKVLAMVEILWSKLTSILAKLQLG